MKSPNLDDLEPLVIKWADEKGIFKNGTPYKQLLKTGEEILELLHAIEDNNLDEIEDAIGDIVVTLIIYAEMKKITCKRDFKNHSFKADDSAAHRLLADYAMLLQAEKFGQSLKPIIHTHEMMMVKLHYIANKYNLNIWECLKTAYNVIKNRKGKMINGTFVKDEK